MREISKVIHYCWFGGNPLPELAVRCIESWKKYCPGYEIKEWNESNFDFNCCDYVKEAYEAKKWAFVSDYARFKILYENGGLYFDTDVELIRPIEDIIAKGAFMGFERDADEKNMAVAPGLGFYREVLDAYEKRHFIREDGSYDQFTVVRFVTEILVRHGLVNKEGIQKVADIYIYPTEYFCPKDFATGRINCTKNTRAIHHFTASWYSTQELKLHKMEERIGRIFGKNFRLWLKKRYFYRIPTYLYKNGLRKTIKRILQKDSK